MKTKLFFDTEFTGLHQATTLVSIGIISDSGKTFYAELTDYAQDQLDDWLRENVIANLLFKEPLEGEMEHHNMVRHSDNPVGEPIHQSYSVSMRTDMVGLKESLTDWLAQFGEVEVWSDCLAYDWMLFNTIFGHAFKIPKNVYYIPFDICTSFKDKGVDPDVNREEFAGEMGEEPVKHNALWDAKVIRKCYMKLQSV